MAGLRGGGAPISFETVWACVNRDGPQKLLAMLDGDLGRAGEQPLMTNREYLAVYAQIFDMCNARPPNNHSEGLYERHARVVREYLCGRVLPALRDKEGAFLLRELARRWQHHGVVTKWMKRFFQYLDKYFVVGNGLPTTDEQGLRAFEESVFQPMKAQLARAAFELVNADRDGQQVDRSLVKRCVEVFVSMGQGRAGAPRSLAAYEAHFLAPLVAATEAFFVRRAAGWVAADNVPTYLAKVEDVLAREAERARACMNEGATEAQLMGVVQDVLLSRQLRALVENEGSGVRVMLREDRREDLARLFRLYSRLPVDKGLTEIARVTKEHLLELGSAIVRDRVRPAAGAGAGTGGAGGAGGAGGEGAKEKESVDNPAFVRALLDLHDRAKLLVANEFNAHPLFQQALKSAFEGFVNAEVDREAGAAGAGARAGAGAAGAGTGAGAVTSKFSNVELLAAYSDRVLRAGSEKLGEEQIEAECERIVGLFAFVADKDFFADYFRGHLAKRLLNDKSASSDQERSMIGKLKMRCGTQYTGKMEGMLNDLAAARELTAEYKAWGAKEAAAGAGAGAGGGSAGAKAAALAATGGIEFSAQVLTTGWWPAFPGVGGLVYPPAMAACKEHFQAFYLKSKPSRMLAWQASHGSALVTARFPKGNFELDLVTLQAVVLLAFNERGNGADAAPVTFAAVRDAVMGPGAGGGADAAGAAAAVKPLKVALHSLCCGKFELLSKTPKSGLINDADTFKVNLAFESKLRKMKVPMASLERSGEGAGPNPDDSRVYAIEACAVRVMKARKSLTHQQLITEVISQLQFFRPTVKAIKKCFENLIEREYLQREGESYVYLA